MCRGEIRGGRAEVQVVFWDAHSWYARHIEIVDGWVLVRKVVACRTEAATKLESMRLQRHRGTIVLSLLPVSDVGIKS